MTKSEFMKKTGLTIISYGRSEMEIYNGKKLVGEIKNYNDIKMGRGGGVLKDEDREHLQFEPNYEIKNGKIVDTGLKHEASYSIKSLLDKIAPMFIKESKFENFIKLLKDDNNE